MRTLVKHPGLLVSILLLCQLTAFASFAQTASDGTNVEQQLVDDPGFAGCQTMPNGQRSCEGFGSKLMAHDSILVTQSVHLNAAPAPTNHSEDFPGDTSNATAVCYSVINRSDKSYYVPWNTAKEWRQFLIAVGAPNSLGLQLAVTPPNISPQGWVADVAVGSCCAPQEVGTICQGISGDIVSHAQLGYRWNDMMSGHQANWGAQSDVYGPVFASSVNGDSSINFQVTYVCSNGSWIQTHALGSCVPLDGQCATGSSSLTSLPADTTTLCAVGSVISNLQGPPGGPWTWTCQGTPGRADATCSTGPANGSCGTLAGWPYDGWGGPLGPYPNGSYPYRNLCANGTTPSGVTGPDYNTANGGGVQYVASLYHWTCNGTGVGSSSTQCSAPEADGVCATGITDATWRSTAPNPATDLLCYVGTPYDLNYGNSLYAGDFGTLLAWNWRCAGVANTDWQNDMCTSWDLNQAVPGVCGDASNHIYNSPTIPPPSLCEVQNTLVSAPVYLTTPVPHWTWTCQGSNNGSTTTCNANVDTNPPQCGGAATISWVNQPQATDDVCSSGTFSLGTNTPFQWDWNCLSTAGNSIDCNAPVAFIAQCGPANGVPSATQPDHNDTCMYGSNDVGVNSDGTTWTWQCWGWNNGGSILNCSAPLTGTNQQNPSCGSANGVSTTSQPTTGLCGVGFATNITQGAGAWTWDCISGSNDASCSAPNGGSGPGICGLANLTSIPNSPNVNLCTSGQATAVAGAGPWTWTCLGLGPNAGQDQNCHADLCGACTGTSVISGSVARSGTLSTNGCSVSGTSTWSETDAITTSSSNKTLRWTDDLNNPFQKVISAQAASGYCPPCFRSPQSISNVQTSVHGTSGSCPGDGQVNSGNPFSLPATNVQVQ